MSSEQNTPTEADCQQSTVHYQNALANYEKGDDTSAIKELGAAIKLNNKNIKAYCLMAKIKNKQECYRYAIFDCYQAKSLGTSEELGFFAEFLEEYTRLIESKPDSVDLHFARGQIKFLMGMYTEALEDLFKVLSLDPNDVETYSVISKVKEALGDTKGAQEYLDKKDEILYQEMQKLMFGTN